MKRAVARPGHALAASLLLARTGGAMAEAEGRDDGDRGLGDSLTAGLACRRMQASRRSSRRALQGARQRREGGQCRRVGRHGGRRRCSGSTGRCLRDASAVIIELGGNDALQGIPPEGNQGRARQDHRGGARRKGCRCCSPAWRRRAIWARTMWMRSARSIPNSPRNTTSCSIPFFLDGVAMQKNLTHEDGMHPNAQGVARIVEGIMPKVEELLARAAAKG